MFYQFSWQGNFGAYLLPAHSGERERCRFLVAREIGFHKTVFGFQGRILTDIVANRLRGDGLHVLARCIAGCELEQEIDVIALDRYSNVGEFAAVSYTHLTLPTNREV